MVGLWLLSLLCLTNAAPEFQSTNSHEIGAPTENKLFPGFPKSYQVSFTFYMPYVATFSPSNVKYDVQIWVDGEDEEDHKVRIDNNYGLNKVITLKDVEYIVNPRIDEIMCRKGSPEHEHGNKRAFPQDMKNWTYQGDAYYQGNKCQAWLLTETFFERVAYYTFYVTDSGVPLYLSAIGQDYLDGTHFDEYVYIFNGYVPGKPDPSVFEKPPECKDQWWPMRASGETRRPLKVQMDFLIPRVVEGHPDYDAFLNKYGRQHSSPIEYTDRMEIYIRNKRFVEEHNMKNDATYTLELNQFADWTDEEFIALKTGHLTEDEKAEEILAANSEMFYGLQNSDLPENFSYVGTPADGPVKDQANCGSCWAFAATGAMEGAWYLANNESISLSEQQLMDCSWNFFNNACSGGSIAMAIIYTVFNFGISSEYSYSYKGYDDWCQAGGSPAAAFATAGIVQMGNIEATKQALLTYGPLGVSMDADHLEFRFYKEGVFSLPECKFLRTNHAVTLLGWGSEGGKDYWIIKNSWSSLWGNKGYIKIDMEYDCGVTSRPVFAIPYVLASEGFGSISSVELEEAEASQEAYDAEKEGLASIPPEELEEAEGVRKRHTASGTKFTDSI